MKLMLVLYDRWKVDPRASGDRLAHLVLAAAGYAAEVPDDLDRGIVVTGRHGDTWTGAAVYDMDKDACPIVCVSSPHPSGTFTMLSDSMWTICLSDEMRVWIARYRRANA